MFVEIHQLKESGFKMAQVARRLNIDRKTVSKYWDVQPDEFAKLITGQVFGRENWTSMRRSSLSG